MWKKIRDYIFCAGISKEQYASIKEDILDSNYQNIRAYCSVIMFFMGILLLFSCLTGVFSTNHLAYIIGFVGASFILGMTNLIDRKKSFPVTLLTFLFDAMLLAFGMYISLICVPKQVTLALIVMLIIIPFLFIAKPYRLILIYMVTYVVFAVAAYFFKPKDIMVFDLVNVVFYGTFALCVGIYSMGVRYERYLYANKVREMSQMDHRINRIIQRSLREKTPDKVITELLARLGKEIQSDRIYIFEDRANGETTENTYEWCREGVTAQIDNLKDVNKNTIGWWYEEFQKGNNMFITDVESLKTTQPECYEILQPQQIDRLFVIPLVIGGNIEGFYGVDNPRMEDMQDVSSFMTTIGTFIASMIELRNSFRIQEQLAEMDLMTGILNRGSGEDAIRQLMEANTEGMFIILDVDKFKSINDTFGHHTGDKVLISIAEAMKQASGVTDVVMRMGGDEFAAFVPGISSKQQMEEHIERFISFVEKIRIPEIQDRFIAVSIGASINHPEELLSFESLYKRADEALYQSKAQQGCTYHLFT